MGILEYYNKRQKTCDKVYGMTHELPQLIIQRIQSFLSEREAVYSSFLSKEWLRAWSTFPVLQFDQSRFVMGRNLDAPNTEGTVAKFVSFVDRTLFRYRIHNLLVEELHLSISIIDGLLISRLNSWFARATELNLKKYFVKIEPTNFSCALSLKAFATDTLESLSISGCRLDKLQITNCNLLVSLNLTEVDIDDQVLQFFFSKCPFIETFTLLRPNGLRKLHMTSLLHLKSLTTELGSNVIVEIDAPSIQSIQYSVADFPKRGRLSIKSCQNLTYVCIFGADIGDLFADKFPSLKDLDLRLCSSLYDVHIRSDSLSTLNVFDLFNHLREIKIDAPNLESLGYNGDKVPKFASRNNAQSRLKATLNFFQWTGSKRKWLMELNEALKELHQSEVCLSLKTRSWFQISLEEVRAISCPSLEHVDFHSGQHWSPLGILEAFFSICRPKYISLPMWFPPDQAEQSAEFLTEMLLTDRTNLSCCSCLDVRCWRRCLKRAEMVPEDDPQPFAHCYRFISLEW